VNAHGIHRTPQEYKMPFHFVTYFIVAASFFVAGYACRGSVRKELVEFKTLVLTVLSRLTALAKKDEATVKAEIESIVADIRKKF
jgi:hypothetical protein